MGTVTTNNQLANFIKQDNLSGKSFLELGFLQQDNVLDLKQLVLEQGASFYRSNVEDGELIDFVWDLHKPFSTNYPIQKFDYVICSSVMEHIAKPWIAAKNIEDIIKSNGKLFWTTPWVWKIHGYPDDYWRYTPSAVKQIFSSIDWCFEGFEVIFDKYEKSILFDWEKGMENHVFGFANVGFDKLQPNLDYACFDTKDSFKEKKVTMVDQKRSKIFLTKKFSKNTYKTLMSGRTINMLPMSNLFMIGKKCE